jgi:DNA-binding XRE family transcriptional regulator
MSLLRELRNARGETQAQVASAVNTKRSTYAHIEIGRMRPSLTLALAISSHFGTSVEKLFSQIQSDSTTPA